MADIEVVAYGTTALIGIGTLDVIGDIPHVLYCLTIAAILSPNPISNRRGLLARG